MKITAKNIENTTGQYIANIDGATWQAVMDEAKAKLVESVTVPGFRPGKAPLDLASGYLTTTQLVNKAINLFAHKAYEQAILENAIIVPYNRPSIDIIKADDKECELHFNFALTPTIKIGKYKGLKTGISKEIPPISDEAVATEINVLLHKYLPTPTLEKATIAHGDVVFFRIVEASAVTNVFLKFLIQDFMNEQKMIILDTAILHKTNEYEQLFVNHFLKTTLNQKVGSINKIVFDIPQFEEQTAKKIELIVEIQKICVLPPLAINEVFLNKFNTFYKTKHITEQACVDWIKQQIEKEATLLVKDAFHEKIIELIFDKSKVNIAEAVIMQELPALKEEFIGKLKTKQITYNEYRLFTKLSEEAIDQELIVDAERKFVIKLMVAEIFKLEKMDMPNHFNSEDLKNIEGSLDPNNVEQFRKIVTEKMKENLVFEFLWQNNS